MLNVQVTAYGRQIVSDRGVVRSCDPLKFLEAHITGTAEPKVVKLCTQDTGWYINSSNRMIITQSPTKMAWLWSRDCLKILPFAVMQRVARVCQRQLSYLFTVGIHSAIPLAITVRTRNVLPIFFGHVACGWRTATIDTFVIIRWRHELHTAYYTEGYYFIYKSRE